MFLGDDCGDRADREYPADDFHDSTGHANDRADLSGHAVGLGRLDP